MRYSYLKQYIRILKDHLKYWKKDYVEYNYLKSLLNQVEIKCVLNKTIVFNTVRTIQNIIDIEFFIGKLLELNGAKVFFLIDDGILKHWDLWTYDSHKDVLNSLETVKELNLNPYPMLNSYPALITLKNQLKFIVTTINKFRLKKIIKTFSSPNFKIIYYSKIIKNQKINDKSHKQLRKFAKSSTIRFFKTSELDYNNKFVRYYYHLSLVNAIIGETVGKYILNKIKPDYFVTSHGIYSTWGPTFDYLKKKNMKIIVYSSVHGHSLNPQEIYTSYNSRTYFLSQSEAWLQFKEKPVNDYMIKMVEDYFDKRQKYGTTDTNILYGGNTSDYIVDKNDGYKYHIALFPNVIWDGNIRDRHKVFSDYRDWILSTIDFIKDRKDIKLYIKSHPSEITVLKNSPRVVDIIKKYINLEMYDNIELITPERRIHTYKFLKSGIDMGIVYDGFLAVEIPFLKIPTIMCVKGGMFTVEGGNFPVSNRKEYFDYLENLDKLIKKFHDNYENYYRNIIRYSFWYIFENAIKLPIRSHKGYIGTDILQLRKKDLISDPKLLKLFTN